MSQNPRCFEFGLIQNKPQSPSQSSFSSVHRHQDPNIFESGIFSSRNADKNKEKLIHSMGLEDMKKSDGNLLQHNNFPHMNPTSPKEFIPQHPFQNKL